tara:strand:+ start:374 stop:562 length:189 start_codon:yes stop_codon:yes gene_type:complete
MPGATLQDMLSMSEASLKPAVVDFFVPFGCWDDFLQAYTWKSFESGGTILTDLATLSLFLKE